MGICICIEITYFGSFTSNEREQRDSAFKLGNLIFGKGIATVWLLFDTSILQFKILINYLISLVCTSMHLVSQSDLNYFQRCWFGIKHASYAGSVLFSQCYAVRWVHMDLCENPSSVVFISDCLFLDPRKSRNWPFGSESFGHFRFWLALNKLSFVQDYFTQWHTWIALYSFRSLL